ncbi:MAG: LacI family DNA-binding transcriptional regulator [Ardenticatenaceae bacterium]|nr:LacI family DNA-binding transcriptional regulator [Ardenticatenaceae bacterium]MCB8949631.1 LacI family DNA-binding transcriptional regulator [Ardenticatenaceae bacterium]
MASTKRNANRNSVTMHDVAKLANVSQSTVSRVLNETNGPITIGEETRQRVLEAAQQLKYQPNLHAGSLRGQKTRMIALMIADITNPFYHPLVRAVQDAANAHQYDTMIANTDHTLEGEQHFINSVIRRPVDGIIMVPYHLSDDDLDELVERTGSIVAAVGQHLTHPQVDIAFGNDRQATYDVVTWLHTEKGHSQLGFIGVTDNFPAGARRHKGFKDALLNVGLEQQAEYELEGDWSPESGYQAMQKLLSLPEPPTAVFACNDLMAIGAMEAIKQSGLRIPEDIAIVGFDDIPTASWISPRLSTVAQYPAEMGIQLAKAIFERIQGNYTGPSRRIEVPCRFIERETT